MSEMREIILDTTARIFTDLGAPQEIILAGDDGWKAPLCQGVVRIFGKIVHGMEKPH